MVSVLKYFPASVSSWFCRIFSEAVLTLMPKPVPRGSIQIGHAAECLVYKGFGGICTYWMRQARRLKAFHFGKRLFKMEGCAQQKKRSFPLPSARTCAGKGFQRTGRRKRKSGTGFGTGGRNLINSMGCRLLNCRSQ